MGSFQNPLLILIIYIQVYKSLVKLVKISIGNPATKPY